MNTTTFGLAVGGVMAGLGIYIAARLVMDAAPLTGSLALDVAFAVFFVARGALQYHRYRRARERISRE